MAGKKEAVEARVREYLDGLAEKGIEASAPVKPEKKKGPQGPTPEEIESLLERGRALVEAIRADWVVRSLQYDSKDTFLCRLWEWQNLMERDAETNPTLAAQWATYYAKMAEIPFDEDLGYHRVERKRVAREKEESGGFGFD